jgi:hypothetical protein
MPSTNTLLFRLAQVPIAVPSPTPRPGGGGGGGGSSGPIIDLGPLLDALNPKNLFADFLLHISQQLAEALQNIWDRLWHGLNVFTYTAPSLSYQFAPVAELLIGMRLLVGAITAIGVVLAAAALAGRQVFGWGEDLGEHLGRLGLAAILANGAPLWVQQAIDLNNLLCNAIGGAPLSGGFRGYGVDALSSSILLTALLWFGLKLGLKMLYRIGMLWILIPVAPIALACWAIPQAQWVARTWTRLFVGWTFGQVLVTIALKLGFTAGPFGPAGTSVGGLIFNIAMAAMACDLVDLLVGASGPHFGGSAGATFAFRAVSSIRSGVVTAYAKAGAAANQRRLPGF